ncbi:MAG: hypothetical protein ABIO04_14230 [Ferruginibacter sp.]
MKQNGALHNTIEDSRIIDRPEPNDEPTVKNNFDSLLESAANYVETRLDLFKLKSIDKATEMMSTVFSKLIVFMVFFLFLIIINIGIGLFLGDLLGRASYGFLVLAGIYLITAIIFNSMQDKWFKQPILNMIIKKFF